MSSGLPCAHALLCTSDAPAAPAPSPCASAALAGSVSSEFQLGSAFLKELGFENPAEIARILDIAMNPDSIFVSFKDKKLSKNDNVRPASQAMRDIKLACASAAACVSP